LFPSKPFIGIYLFVAQIDKCPSSFLKSAVTKVDHIVEDRTKLKRREKQLLITLLESCTITCEKAVEKSGGLFYPQIGQQKN